MHWIFVGASTVASEFMIHAVRAQADCDVTWLVSGSSEHAARYSSEHKIARSTSSIEEALSDNSVSCVYISSTNEKHFAQAMAAIAAGKHVLCEKPLALTLNEARQMVAAAHQADLVFGTNHHLRCSGSHRKIREMISDGEIGRVISVRVHHAVHLPKHLQAWRINDASAGGGVIPDITVHNVDVVRFLLAEDPVEVVAQSEMSGMGVGVEDSCMSVWRMPSGAMVMSHESFTHPFAGTGLEIHGTQGSIVATGVMTQQPVGSISLRNADGERPIPFSDHSLYTEVVADFVSAVHCNGAASASGSDGIKSLAVALAVREAAQKGQSVSVNYE
ncbi:MAG: Gfo/Idh/MocA family protein [Granulosicoccus sp.]